MHKVVCLYTNTLISFDDSFSSCTKTEETPMPKEDAEKYLNVWCLVYASSHASLHHAFDKYIHRLLQFYMQLTVAPKLHINAAYKYI